MRKLTPIPFGDARWTGGFWDQRQRLCHETMIPSMGRLMTQTERVKFLGNLEVAAGLVEGRHRGPRWNDGDFYKWLEAAAADYALTKEASLDAMMDVATAIIAKAQRSDGYIHSDIQIRQRNGESVQPFDNPMDFEMYNMGHLMTAACVHHRATGKRNLLEVASKAADFLDKQFANPTPQQARHGICPSHLMGLIDLYRTTDEKRYLDLAIRLLNMRDLVESGDDDNQDRVPLRKESRAVGHAVRGTYLWAGAADIAAETGDAALLVPLQKIWADLVHRKLYITGGCGALFDGASPDGAEDQKSITRVHQSFGRDYQLPNSTAHNETCAAIGNLLWNWRMLQLTGESRFADIIELTLYNSVLAGMSLDGTRFFYTNTLRQIDPMPVELRWPRQRQQSLSCFCCPPNVVRTIAQSSTFAYAKSDRGVYVNLYGTSHLDSPIKLRQETDYPWDGRVRVTIESSGEFSLFLRIPGFSGGATVNGDSVNPGFHEIRRRWSPGDIVELNLPMPPRLIESHPYVEETRNHVAVMRGPLVYCLESIDLPPNVWLMDVLLPADTKLTPRRESILHDVTVIDCDGLHLPHENSDQLYRDLKPTSPQPLKLTLIPYYAWENRGKSEMSVWLPIATQFRS